MPTFGWHLGDAQRREERRLTEERRAGRDRRMPLRPYVQTRVPTKRQLEILALSAHGLTYDQVAAELHMSHYTVKSQIRGLCKRINARNLPNAIAICFVQGWLVPNSPP